MEIRGIRLAIKHQRDKIRKSKFQIEYINVARSTKKEVEMLEIRSKILVYCANQSRSLTDISEYLIMNRHTVRTSYLHPMVRESKLHSIQKNGSKTSTRYRTS